MGSLSGDGVGREALGCGVSGDGVGRKALGCGAANAVNTNIMGTSDFHGVLVRRRRRACILSGHRVGVRFSGGGFRVLPLPE
eukprot:8449433-Heterocapsa_arctica.AAC.1